MWEGYDLQLAGNGHVHAQQHIMHVHVYERPHLFMYIMSYFLECTHRPRAFISAVRYMGLK